MFQVVSVDSLFIVTVAPIVCSSCVFCQLPPLFAAVVCLVYVFNAVQFCNHLDGEERAGWFTLIVFFMSCDC